MKSTIYETREDWLKARTYHIGASDVATILGVNPYKSAFALWHEKKGLVPRSEAGIAARVGLALEPLLTEFYEQEQGVQVVDPGPYTVYEHPKFPWLTCTPDRLIVDADGKIVKAVELKTIGEFVAQKLRDGEPPLGYQVQLQAQMEILGCGFGDLACLIGNRKFEVFQFTRHERLVREMLIQLRAFWERLETGDPPPPDGTPSTAATLKALHPDDNGETTTLFLPAREAYKQYKAAKEQIKGLQQQADAYKNEVIAAIGPNTWMEDNDLRLSYKTQERAAYARVSEADIPALDKAGIEYKATKATQYRVLREERKDDHE